MPDPLRSSASFGTTLRALMLGWNGHVISYRELAARSGFSAGYLHHVLNGRKPVPDAEALARIAGAFDLGADVFLEHRIRAVADWLPAEPEMVEALYARVRGSAVRTADVS